MTYIPVEKREGFKPLKERKVDCADTGTSNEVFYGSNLDGRPLCKLAFDVEQEVLGAARKEAKSGGGEISVEKIIKDAKAKTVKAFKKDKKKANK